MTSAVEVRGADRRGDADRESLRRVTQDAPQHGADHRGAIRALLARIEALEAEVALLRAVPNPVIAEPTRRKAA